MDVDETPGLLRSVLGFFARKPAERPIKTPKSLRARRQDAWLRTDAFLQHDADAFDEMEPEQRKRTLHALEGYVKVNPDGEPHFNFLPEGPYPKLQALRNMVDSPNPNQGLTIRFSKRSRQRDQIIEEIEHMDRDSKKRRVITREESSASESFEGADAEFAMLTRRHLVSLDNALRKQWVCVCQKCSGLSVRLSLPQKKDPNAEPSFDVIFGVRSVPATSLQEAKITIKDAYNRGRSSSAPVDSGAGDLVHICQSITDSLGQRNCLHLALEHGIFQRLRPQPKTFGVDQKSRTMTLAALFKRHQELRGSSSALSLKGKRVLAVTLASALLPFLETPWLQPSFNHSKILFFQPLEDGQLPDITRPFIAMEHIPIITAGKRTGTNVSSSDVSNQSIHPNSSVLALGILLCELHHLTSVEHWQKDPDAEKNVNTDWYTCLEILRTLEDEAGLDYYLATKACLYWEYFPAGQDAAFESETVQRLFYQNVVKRLEAEMFKTWRLRIEDLSSFDSKENENCWGSIGREVVRLETGRCDPPTDKRNGVRSPAQRSMSAGVLTSSNSDMAVHEFAQPTPAQVTEDSTNNLHFFDASHQTCCEQENALSRKWMDNLLSSIYQFVDPFEPVQAGALQAVEPVRIAILDSGFDPENPLLRDDLGRIDPRIKAAQSFVHGTEPQDIGDEIGHGTHALGLLLKVATCAEIYIGKIAHRATLNRNTYDDIAKASLADKAEPPFLGLTRLCIKAINHAVSEWKVDIISMSFGIREYNEPMKRAISNALHGQTLLFAAASNDGANLGRAFPAKYPSIFCIHSTDGNGNPSTFNPTADDKDVNFSLLGENVSSYWPVDLGNGLSEPVNAMSGTSVATPIAAGLAASVLSFVRQQDQHVMVGSELLGPWLKDVHSMDMVLKSMASQTRGAGYNYIRPSELFDRGASREKVYDKIKDLRRHMYD